MSSASQHLAPAFARLSGAASRRSAPPVTRCHAVCHADDDVSAPEGRSLSSGRRALFLAAGVGASIPIPARPARASEASNLASLASQEPDAEIALEVWDEVVRLARRSGELATPTGGNWMYSRATCLGGLSRWTDAERAYAEAADVLELALESSRPGKRDRAGALTLALAHDGRSLALGALSDCPAAVDEQTRARRGGAAGVARTAGWTSPPRAPRGFARWTPHGGAAARLQRGDGSGRRRRGFAANALARLDKGPSPVAGRGGQFWEARAALAAALYANGSLPAAEAEWSQLCEPVGPNPPATPSDPFRKVVNKAAQGAFDAGGILMDKRCEDFSTGTPLPCDDAGIPGSGGSASPCLIFTDAETERRLWPASARRSLLEFIRDGPEALRR